MPPAHTTCGPLDLLREASLWEAICQPPWQMLKSAGPCGMASVLLVLVAGVVAHTAHSKRVARWLWIIAAICVLLAGDAAWFHASRSAERVRAMNAPSARDAGWSGSHALGAFLAGFALALLASAQHLPARLRVRAQAEGRSRLPAACVTVALLGGSVLATVLLDGPGRSAEEWWRAEISRSRAQRVERIGAIIRDLGLQDVTVSEDGPVLEAALAKDPENPDLLLLRGLYKNRQGDQAGAVADVRRARELDPHPEDAPVDFVLPWEPRR